MNFLNENIIKQIDNYEVELPKNDWQQISQRLKKQPQKSKIAPLSWAAAAGAALIIGIGIVLNFQNHDTKNFIAIEKQTDIQKKDIYNLDNQNVLSQNFNNNLSIHQKKSLNKNSNDNLKKNLTKEKIETKIICKNSDFDIENTEKEALSANKKEQKSAQKHISVEDAETLMKTKHNSTEQPKSKGKNQKTHRYYASLSASASPTNFQSKEKTPRNMFIPSMLSNNAVMSTCYSETKHDLPLTVGLSFGIPLAKRFFLNTGLHYTYIHSKTEKFENRTRKRLSKNDQVLHYLGISLMPAYRIVDGRIFKLYVSVGGAAEKGLCETHSKETFQEAVAEKVLLPEENRKIYGFQFSLNANIGASVTLFKGLAIYIEPGLAWYIPAVKYPQPYSRRTQNPYFFNIAGGLRYNFDK